MYPIPNRSRRVLQIAAALFPLLAIVGAAKADIFQWEYINPADPSQGKQQSTTLAPDGAGVDAVPGADLQYRNLTMAYLIGADLTNANGIASNLTNADLSHANLTNAGFGGANLTGVNFREATLVNVRFVDYTSPICPDVCSATHTTLTDADFTGADVRGASFVGAIAFFGQTESIITLAQLYSTASYQAHDLSGIGLISHDLTGGNFTGQSLVNASFYGGTLTDADFTGADVRGVNFSKSYWSSGWFGGDAGTGVSPAQLYSTASFQAHELSGIRLNDNELAGANFVGQNLTDAQFESAELTGADFRQANLTNADFTYATLTGADFTGAEVRGANIAAFTFAQLYSTANYQSHDLTGIRLSGDLAGGNFAGQNLTNATFNSADLRGADFREANLSNADFGIWRVDYRFEPGATLWGATFRNANLHSAFFVGASLTDADFTGAEIRGASFGVFRWDYPRGGPYGTGISLAQLYSTASYQAHDLTGVSFWQNDLTGGNFTSQNLTNVSFGGANLTGANLREANLANASFVTVTFGFCCNGEGVPTYYRATLIDADLTAADARGASGLDLSDLSEATTANLIWPDGHIHGLEINDGGQLIVRDYDGNPNYDPFLTGPIPITIDEHLAMAPGGTLQMVFEADAWDSTISFAPGIPVTLGGTLELAFADDVNLASQVGRTLDLFDWTGVTPTGAFAIASPYVWNLSNLYTTGEVTFVSVPEPRSLFLTLTALAAFFATRHSNRRSRQATRVAASAFSILILGPLARADIFQWEYINPADPSQGKLQSTTLCPDGAGVDAVPGADLSNLNLSMAYLNDADLSFFDSLFFSGSNLAGTNLSRADLRNANLTGATLTDADFTDADVREASFDIGHACAPFWCYDTGTGISLPQIYSTASYQAHDLSGISLHGNNLAGGNFAFQILTDANFSAATLTGADFREANLTNARLGGTLTGANFREANLTNASFYGAMLTGANFREAHLTNASFVTSRGDGAELAGANFIAANLTSTDLSYTNLTEAEFTDAEVRGAQFDSYFCYSSPLACGRRRGITTAQLYSTASYQAHDLSGIDLTGNYLAGGNFAGQNLINAQFGAALLTGANFRGANLSNAVFAISRAAVCIPIGGCAHTFVYATLTDADLTAADARGAFLELPASAITTNLIWPDGHIRGLDLDAGGLLVVRDYNGRPYQLASLIPITVDQHLVMGPGGTLQMVFEADAWDSTISFAPGIPITLGGTLELNFAADVNLASQVGRTFDLFNWTGVDPTGAFAVSSPYRWNLSNLYTTGEVTLTVVPEPATVGLLFVGVLTLANQRRGRTTASVLNVGAAYRIDGQDSRSYLDRML